VLARQATQLLEGGVVLGGDGHRRVVSASRASSGLLIELGVQSGVVLVGVMSGWLG
jgi:hypothetical protein